MIFYLNECIEKKIKNHRSKGKFIIFYQKNKLQGKILALVLKVKDVKVIFETKREEVVFVKNLRKSQ